jgi:hypothetical protein
MVKTNSVQILGHTVPLWAVAVGFVTLALIAYSPYLGSGFSGDDFFFISMLEGDAPYDPLLGFWAASSDSYHGLAQLWWAELGSQGGAFLRPLASWVLTLLYVFFGRNAVPFHVTLVVVHGLVGFISFLLLRRLSGRDAPALLATLMFLICEDHGMTVAWIATITDLLCALFLSLALLCHVVARQEGKRWPFVLSLLCFVAALASKETAAVYPAIVVAYEFIYAGRLDGGERQATMRTRIRLLLRHWWAWGVPLAVFVAYMIVYRSIIPAWGSLAYLDPFSQPGQFLYKSAINLPVMLVGLLTPFLPSLALLMPATYPFVVTAGMILCGLVIWALLPYRRESAIWFCLVVFVLGLLPGLATEPGERLLYFPSVYGLFVVAWLILQIPRLRERLSPESPRGVRVLGRVWGWYLLFATLVVPAILLPVLPSMWIPGLQLPEQTILRSLPLIDEDMHQHVVYLNTDSSYNTFYLPEIYRYHREEYVDLRVLSSFNGRVSARQDSERVLSLRTQDVGWLSNMFARIVRLSPRFRVGDEHHTGLFTATVAALTPQGKDVAEVRFEFVVPLDDPALVFLYYDGESYRRWDPSPEWELLNSALSPLGF